MQRSITSGGEIITYELIQTARQSTELRVLPGGVRVFAPRNRPLKQIDSFVAEKADWIRASRARLNAYADREHAQFPMTTGMSVPLEGVDHTLIVRTAPRAQCRVEDGGIILSSPDTAPEAVKEQLRAFLIEQARTRIDQRLEHYIPLIGRMPGRIFIRDQRTRWGSCSSEHNLNFNWKLIMAPPEALDYVVIHELCHLYEFNHSTAFWNRVARYQSDYAVWRGFLRSGWVHPYP